MVLSPGTRVGPYEISAPLGAGGLGEVYRARDPRLGREVAIKVLRAGVVGAQDRRRLDFEARAASQLNHPNILTIHDIGEENGTPFIVSELLDGDSLRALIAPGGIPVRRVLDIAVQVADGLAAAHANRLIHRDLKPDNVMVLRDGRVKILDFGLAKPDTTRENTDETMTALRGHSVSSQEMRTDPGLIVGTLSYMSPEQAQGDAIDYRSDQFAFGVMLYEMATGRRPFQRADRVSTLAAIVREEPPPLASLNPLVPPPLRWVVDRCLAKQASHRFASTADLHQQLRDIREHISEIVSSDLSGRPLQAARRPRWVLPLTAALALLAIGFFTAFRLHWHDRSLSDYRFTPFATEAMLEMEPAWSPDGRTLAYIGSVDGVGQVFVRSLDSPVPAQTTNSPVSCRSPFWSPDGSRLFYWAASSLWSVGAAGGSPQPVVNNLTVAAPAATMSPDGKTLAFFRSEGQMRSLYFMDVASGAVKRYRRAPFPESFRLAGSVLFSPAGDKLIASIVPAIGPDGGAETWVLAYPDGTPRRIAVEHMPRGFRTLAPSWLPDNRRLVFSAELVPGEGNHLYVLDTEDGAVEVLTRGTGDERDPAVSRDGTRVAFSSGGSNSDLIEVSTDGSRLAPLLATSRQEHSADWSPSGRQFAYVSDAAGKPEIWLRSPAEGWAMPIVRASEEGHLEHAALRFAPGGERLAYVRTGRKHLIWISNVTGGQAVPLETESADQHCPAWSPDGNWIAYTRFASTGWELAKAPSGGGGRPVRLAKGGYANSAVEWSPAGDAVAFTEDNVLYTVEAAGGTPKAIATNIAGFMYEQNRSTLLAVRRTKDRSWEIAELRAPDGHQVRSTPLRLPHDATVAAMRGHPDGSRFVLSVANMQRDIWVLEGFKRRSGLLDFLRRPE